MREPFQHFLLICLLSARIPLFSENLPREEDYYRLINIPAPPDVVMEVGGLDWLDAEKTRLVACTRRGEVWIMDNPYADPPVLAKPEDNESDSAKAIKYKRILFGLNEPLGIHVDKEWMYLVQRGELTRIRDTDGDEVIDEVETFNRGWGISGNYHEFAFGPQVDLQGNFWITLNRPFGDEPEGPADWRGWAVRVDREGTMHPVCVGLRSPAGLGMNDVGDVFYTDNQGDWVAVCRLSHLKPGSFQGNPFGFRSCSLPNSPMKEPEGLKSGVLWGEAVKNMKDLLAPACWFPYPQMGRSHGEAKFNMTAGKFGPFDKQFIVCDNTTGILIRVSLEKIGGEYQGACYPFRKDLTQGSLRLAWGKDGSLFVGQTARGWGSRHGLQRVVWTGRTPFEILEMKAKPDGFDVVFTKEVDLAMAGKIETYAMKAWTYHHHETYGDKPTNERTLKVISATVGTDKKSVRLVVEGLEPYYVHELKLTGLRSADGDHLLHREAYYTLNQIPAE